MRSLQLYLCVLTCFTQALTANAATLYESAGGIASFTTSYPNGYGRQGWLVRDYRPTWQDATQFAAMPFTLQQDSIVTGAELALTALADWSANYNVQILGDAGGLPSSSVLWTMTTSQAAPIFQPFQVYSFSEVTGNSVLLDANTKYWLYLSCIGKCEISWWADNTNPTPGAIQYNNIYPYNLNWALSESNAAMFRITGVASVVPEPETYAMLLVGLGLLSFTAKRRKQRWFR